MISIKKLIEGTGNELLHVTLECYRAALNAIGESGMRACPPVGAKLRHNLVQLQAALSAESAPASIQPRPGQKVEAELAQWGASATMYKQRTGEVKELMLILACAADLTGERDERYHRQFKEFTGRLESMADMQDLALIRDSLVKGAIDLRACAEAMAEESRNP